MSRPQIPLLLARNTSVSFYPVQAGTVTNGGMVFVSLYDASTNQFPTIGTLANNQVGKGNLYIMSSPGTLGGESVNKGSVIMALVDNPGQTLTNWYFF